MAVGATIAGIGDLGSEEAESLALACLKSRWLTRGIAPDLRDKTPTQHFSFFNSDTCDALREYFRSGSHPLRDGIVYRNLAFVQQVDLGDEWLVLRRVFDDESGEAHWIPFESYSLGRILESPARFECAIRALEEADPYDTATLLGKAATPTRQRQQR